jgi:hypothetical protein
MQRDRLGPGLAVYVGVGATSGGAVIPHRAEPDLRGYYNRLEGLFYAQIIKI